MDITFVDNCVFNKQDAEFLFILKLDKNYIQVMTILSLKLKPNF